jgi:hypothetical protein
LNGYKNTSSSDTTILEDDKSTPSIAHDWKDFKIGKGVQDIVISFHSHFVLLDLMTGDNIKQEFLMNVATVRGKKKKSDVLRNRFFINMLFIAGN